LAHFHRAIEVKPDYAIAHKNIGSMLGVRGEMDTAAHHQVTAARLQPDDKYCFTAFFADAIARSTRR
jgi:hypothetical protein